jgi:uncharacterized radical SAM superfamily Fe-S cluster-containing enzyme
MSPFFIQAVRYARSIGFNSVQAATNGIEFAKNKKFAEAAADAGLRYAYLQFDGIGNAPNSHRKVGNLFDVKLKAIENMHTAGTEIILVTTLVNNVNNEEVGPIIDFARNNPGKIAFISFQPVSFTGRDEEITDERRLRQRYTLSHLARDVKSQLGITEPNRDWFPISVMSSFVDAADAAHGPEAQWGQVNCGCHPNCGVGTALMINKTTKEMAPVAEFIDVPQFVQDIRKVTDSGRKPWLSNLQMGLALLKNYDPYKAPRSFDLLALLRKFDKSFGLSGKNYGKGVARRNDPWNFLFVAGMWFQDLFNYDFRRTERCIIPYATQEGEISFCAYNTGIGWRNIIEKMHMTATLTKWYEERGRHEIFAGGKQVDLDSNEHSLVLDPEAVAAGIQTDLDSQGIAKNARQEKLAARAAAKTTNGNGAGTNGTSGANGTNGANGKSDKDVAYNAQMAALYRQHVLKEEAPPVVQIQGLKSSKEKDLAGVS